MAAAPVVALVLAILALGLGLLLGGVVGLLQWLRAWRRRRANPPRLEPGLVALEGTCRVVDGHPTAPAPLSGEPCCCATLALERDAGDVSRPVWQEVGEDSRLHPFGLETPASTVHVDPAEAIVDLGADETVAVDPDAAIEDLRESVDGLDVTREGGRLRIGPWDLDPKERYRLVERRLEPGDAASVTGTLEPDADNASATGTIRGPPAGSWRSKLISVPFVVADDGGESASYRLRNRALVGFVLGLPPTLLSLVLLFPPGGG